MSELINKTNVLEINEVEFDIDESKSGVIFKSRKFEKKIKLERHYSYKNGIIHKETLDFRNIDLKIITEYNESGYSIQQLEYDKYNCVQSEKHYKYNHLNQIVEIVTNIKSEYSISRFIHKESEEDYLKVVTCDHYRERRNPMLFNNSNVKERFCGFTKSFFIQPDRRTKFEEYDENKILTTTTWFSYNALEQLYKKIVQYANKPYITFLYQRNSKGDIIEIVKESNLNGKDIEQIEYVYDRNNNWTEKKVIKDGHVLQIIERIIRYA